jgi:hypothetical protein
MSCPSTKIVKIVNKNTKLDIILCNTIIESNISDRMNVLANAVIAVSSDNEDDVITVPNNKVTAQASLEGSNRRQGTGYTGNEDLIVCKSFIAASEDALSGTSQKGFIFKQKMYSFFLQYLSEQEQLDYLRYSSLLKHTGPENTLPVYDRRNATSIHTRFNDHLSLRVSKFMGVEKSTNMESGWDTERFYYAVKYNFEQKWPRLGNPDDIRHCVEYLKDKPKWHSYHLGNITSETPNHKRPSGQKKEKSLLKDRELVKATIKELNIPMTAESISSDDDTKQSVLTLAKNDFYTTAGTAMMSYCKSMQEQINQNMISTLATPQKKRVLEAKVSSMLEEIMISNLEIPQKKRVLEAKTSLMLEEIALKKAEMEAQCRRLNYTTDMENNLDDVDFE